MLCFVFQLRTLYVILYKLPGYAFKKKFKNDMHEFTLSTSDYKFVKYLIEFWIPMQIHTKYLYDNMPYLLLLILCKG